jgi:hypothetical protein
MASKSKLWYLDRMDLFHHMDDSAKKWAVNLWLSDFKHQGLVESSGRRLRLRAPEKLATMR